MATTSIKEIKVPNSTDNMRGRKGRNATKVAERSGQALKSVNARKATRNKTATAKAHRSDQGAFNNKPLKSSGVEVRSKLNSTQRMKGKTKVSAPNSPARIATNSKAGRAKVAALGGRNSTDRLRSRVNISKSFKANMQSRVPDSKGTFVGSRPVPSPTSGGGGAHKRFRKEF